MNKVLLTSFTMLLAVSAGCTSNQPVASKVDCEPKVIKSDAKNTSMCSDAVIASIASAGALKKKAASVGGEWRDIGKFLKKAKFSVTEGDCAVASKLAKKAKGQAILGYDQAMSQKTLKMPGYFKF